MTDEQVADVVARVLAYNGDEVWWSTLEADAVTLAREVQRLTGERDREEAMRHAVAQRYFAAEREVARLTGENERLREALIDLATWYDLHGRVGDDIRRILAPTSEEADDGEA